MSAGGIGKTTMATALYNKLLKEKPDFLPQFSPVKLKLAHQGSVDEQTVLMHLNQALEFLGKPKLMQLPEATADLMGGQQLLLFIDDVWDGGLLERLISHLRTMRHNSVIIATSRSLDSYAQLKNNIDAAISGSSWRFPAQGRNKYWHEVEVKPIEDYRMRKQIFSQYADIKDVDSLQQPVLEQLDAIVNVSSGYPIALQAAGSYMKLRGSKDLEAWKV